LEICRKMKENAFINDYWFDEKNRKIKAEIKYDNRRSKISLIKKISTPSKLIYLKKRDIFKYRHSKTTFLLSTNLGILTQKEALEKNVGGKLMISIS
jgi:small subunit ribosomal protein S8